MDQNNTITVIYGSGREKSLQNMTVELLDTVEMADRIPAGSRIALKPNLVIADSPENGATTHTEILEGTIIYLQQHGHNEITIAEGSWVGDKTPRAYKVTGYDKLADRYGVELVDTQKSGSHKVDANGFQLNVCDCMDEFDVLINMPVLKGHCQTRYTGALKNLKGCIPDSEKRRFHSKGLHEPIAQLNTVIKPNFIVMDGICGDPTFEEGGSPSELHRILFSEDPVLLDSYGATVLGLEVEDVPYIGRAEELGVGNLFDGSSILREINDPADAPRTVQQDPKLDQLAALVDQRDACSSCYAALIQALREEEPQSEAVSFAIGRAFRDPALSTEEQKQQLLGIGVCTRCFAEHVPGCPPTPEAIKSYLKRQ